MVNLLLDIGNSSVKASFCKDLSLENIIRYDGTDIISFVLSLIDREEVGSVVISSVRDIDSKLIEAVESRGVSLYIIGNNIESPIINRYKSISTLGSDRLMAAVAVKYLFPNRDVLIFDFGTALTVDFVNSKGEYLGGNISPGLSTRFKALNSFTNRLPLIDSRVVKNEIGESTESAIESGVILGLIFEVEGYMRKYPNHIYVITGGDANFFGEKLKSSIFVVYNLVLMGMAHTINNYAK